MTPRPMLVTASAWISRIIMAFVQIASIRVLIKGLGIEQFTIFALLSALMGWFMLADMGIGLSLQNHISVRRSNSEPYGSDLISIATLSGILFLLFLSILGLLSPYVSSIYLKQFHHLGNPEKARLFFVSGALFIGAAFGNISFKIWYAEQKGHLSNIFPAAASLLAYAGIIIISSSQLENKLLYSLIVFLAPAAIISLGTFITQIIKHFYEITWTLSFRPVLGILKRALSLWFLLLITSLSLQIDYLIISQFLGSKDIVIYNLSTRISWFLFALYVAALTALWPIFSECIAQGNWHTVKRLTAKYLSYGLGLSVICSILLVGLMPIAVHILSPKETIVVPVLLIVLLGIYQLIRIWTDTFIVILQSMSDLKPMWIAIPFQAVLSILFQWYLVQWIGLHGIILGNILSFSLTSAWYLPKAVFRHYKQNSEN